MNYQDFFSQCVGQIKNPAANYEDFAGQDIETDIEIPETVCQQCGGLRFLSADNVGFNKPDPEHIELEYQCENGCDQDVVFENEVLL